MSKTGTSIETKSRLVVVWPEGKENREGVIVSEYRAFFESSENVSILKAIELYALSGWIMNFILKVFLETYTQNPGVNAKAARRLAGCLRTRAGTGIPRAASPCSVRVSLLWVHGSGSADRLYKRSVATQLTKEPVPTYPFRGKLSTIYKIFKLLQMKKNTSGELKDILSAL